MSEPQNDLLPEMSSHHVHLQYTLVISIKSLTVTCTSCFYCLSLSNTETLKTYVPLGPGAPCLTLNTSLILFSCRSLSDVTFSVFKAKNQHQSCPAHLKLEIAYFQDFLSSLFVINACFSEKWSFFYWNSGYVKVAWCKKKKKEKEYKYRHIQKKKKSKREKKNYVLYELWPCVG